jgi:hypothetical protein
MMSDGLAAPRGAASGASPTGVSGRAKEEGACAPPSIETRPFTVLTPPIACNNRKTENTIDVIGLTTASVIRRRFVDDEQ